MLTQLIYEVNSPDGFSISPKEDLYQDKEHACRAMLQWKKRYEAQGYYSSNKGRIALSELTVNSTLLTMDNGTIVYSESIFDALKNIQL